MKRGILYLDKNRTLGCTLICLELNGRVYRFATSDKIKRLTGIRKDKGYDYIVTQLWDDGSKDEECYEFKYLFSEFGIPFHELEKMEEVTLK